MLRLGHRWCIAKRGSRDLVRWFCVDRSAIRQLGWDTEQRGVWNENGHVRRYIVQFAA